MNRVKSYFNLIRVLHRQWLLKSKSNSKQNISHRMYTSVFDCDLHGDRIISKSVHPNENTSLVN